MSLRFQHDDELIRASEILAILARTTNVGKACRTRRAGPAVPSYQVAPWWDRLGGCVNRRTIVTRVEGTIAFGYCFSKRAITIRERKKMRKTILAVATAFAASFAASAPAAAYDYPFCLQGRGVGIPGDCSYQTYAQCMASGSGRALSCNINPRAAFGQQRRARSPYNY